MTKPSTTLRAIADALPSDLSLTRAYLADMLWSNSYEVRSAARTVSAPVATLVELLRPDGATHWRGAATVADDRALRDMLARAWRACRRAAHVGREARRAAAGAPRSAVERGRDALAEARTAVGRLATWPAADLRMLSRAGVPLDALSAARWMRQTFSGAAEWLDMLRAHLATARSVRREREIRRSRERAPELVRTEPGRIAAAAESRRVDAARRWSEALRSAGIYDPTAAAAGYWLAYARRDAVADLVGDMRAAAGDACPVPADWQAWGPSQYGMGNLDHPGTLIPRQSLNRAVAVWLWLRAGARDGWASSLPSLSDDNRASWHALAAGLRTDARFRAACGADGLSWPGTRPARMRRPYGAPAGSSGVRSAGSSGVRSGMVIRSRSGYHASRSRIRDDLALDLVGVEVELCVSDARRREAGGYLVPRGWRCESDASIQPQAGEASAEVVSPPMSWAALESRLAAWHAAMTDGNWNPRAGAARGCGFHATFSIPVGSHRKVQEWFETAAAWRTDSNGAHVVGDCWRRLSGRRNDSMHYGAPRVDSQKHNAISVRSGVSISGGLQLIELRLFQGAVRVEGDLLGRLRAARLVQAVAEWFADSAPDDAQQRIGADGLPVALPASIRAAHADAVAWWGGRYSGAASASAASASASAVTANPESV